MWLNLTQFKFNTSGIFSRNKSVQREITSSSDEPIGEKRAGARWASSLKQKRSLCFSQKATSICSSSFKEEKQELCHK